MDIRKFSRQFVTDFITIYKSHPCLWMVKCTDYNSRHLRDDAYKKIIRFCKRNGFPEANRDFVVKKIQSMRGSFRKELKRVTEAQRIGDDDYIPSLWYYNQLLFTKDQELATDSVKPDINIPNKIEIEEENNKDETVLSPKINQSEVKMITPRVRMKRKPKDSYAEIRNICTKTCQTLIRKEFSEFDATGINVAKKLKRMDPTQAIYAESLINTVLRKGLLNQLIEGTDFCDGGCKSRQKNKSSETPVCSQEKQEPST